MLDIQDSELAMVLVWKYSILISLTAYGRRYSRVSETLVRPVYTIYLTCPECLDSCHNNIVLTVQTRVSLKGLVFDTHNGKTHRQSERS